MKKRILVLAVILLQGLALASCHKGTNNLQSFNMPESFDNTREYNISFWAKNDGNKKQIEIYNQAIESFESIYPNIHVEIRNFASYPDIYKDVLVNIATNTTPNVCIAYPDHVATYKEGNNIVVDLNTLMNNASYGLGGTDLAFDGPKKYEIYPKYLEEGLIENRNYTLPFMRSTEACYINKDYVEALGFKIPDILTWDWMWEVCNKALLAKGDGTLSFQSKYDVLYPMIYKSTDNMFITMAKELGIPVSTEKGEVLLFNEETKKLLLELGDRGLKGEFTTFKKVSYPGNFFNKWESVMCIDSTAGATWLGVDATSSDHANGADGSKPRFETVVRAVPQYDPANPQMISQGPSICIFNKDDPQEVIASWLFSQFLLTDEVQLAYSKTEGYLPVTSRAAESENFTSYLNDSSEYKVKRDASKLVLDNVDNTFISPVFNGSSYVRDAGSYLIEAVCGKNNRYKKYEELDELFEKCIEKNNLSELMDGENTIHRKIYKEGIILLSTIGGVWLLMGGYVLYSSLNGKRKR